MIGSHVAAVAAVPSGRHNSHYHYLPFTPTVFGGACADMTIGDVALRVGISPDIQRQIAWLHEDTALRIVRSCLYHVAAGDHTRSSEAAATHHLVCDRQPARASNR
jgi:hypothetical protein